MHLEAAASKATALLTRRPGLFCKVVLGKLNSARRVPSFPIRRTIGDLSFEYDLPAYQATAPMYFGSYAPLVIDTMKRFLRPGGVFFDVGANIGYLSAVAANLVGTTGQIHAFEPVPDYFRRLQRLAQMNSAYSIFVNATAAGDVPGPAPIYITLEPGQNTLISNYQPEPNVTSTTTVPVIRLESYIAAKGIRQIDLIKIDAEGFELPILRGLEEYFSKETERPPVICEVAPRAYPLIGSSVAELAAYMARFGYSARQLIDPSRSVDICKLKHVDDVLFLSAEAAR